jgi:hypothetical protein
MVGVMLRGRSVQIGAIAVLAIVASPAAEAKFRLTVTVEPARPLVGAIARVSVRTDVALPRRHGIRLQAVGPWQDDVGQKLLEIRLRRIDPYTIAGTVRFSYAGRWRLDIPPSSASPPFQRLVTVRPRPQRKHAAQSAPGQEKVVVTRTRPGLPRGCGPRGAAKVLRGMFDAFSRGDRARFEQSFFGARVPGERFRWFAVYDGVTDVTLVTRSQLLSFLGARVERRDTMRLRRIDIGVDDARGLVHFGYLGVRRADDLPIGRGGTAGIVEGKGAFNCQSRKIVVFTAGMEWAPDRTYPRHMTGRGPCPSPRGWTPLTGPIVACTRSTR